jgi:translocation and assembly module TamA
VRGQPYQALGINVLRSFGTGAANARSGGASFVGAQLEARFDVTDKIGLVGFYDIGLIGIDSLPQAGDDYIAGAGIGLRYDTPIGPIRLDLATPASGDDIGQDLQVYIGIGQSF